MFCKHKWSILNETKVISESGWEKTVFFYIVRIVERLKKLRLNNLTF